MKKLENEDLKDLIKEGVHIVDFYAEWCGPCKMLMPILEDISNNVSIIKVDVDAHGDIAQEYGIMNVPTLLFVKDGKVKSKSSGFQSKEMILKNIEDLK